MLTGLGYYFGFAFQALFEFGSRVSGLWVSWEQASRGRARLCCLLWVPSGGAKRCLQLCLCKWLVGPSAKPSARDLSSHRPTWSATHGHALVRSGGS